MYSGIFVKLDFLAFGLRFVGILKWLAYGENSDNWTDYEYRNEDNIFCIQWKCFIYLANTSSSMQKLLDIS